MKGPERFYSPSLAETMTKEDAITEVERELRRYAHNFAIMIRDRLMTEDHAKKRYTALRLALDMLRRGGAICGD